MAPPSLPSPDGLPALRSRSEARREAVRRLCAIALMAFSFAVALAPRLFGLPTERPDLLLVPVMLAVFTAAFVLTFPWSRFHPRAFVVLGLPANALVAWGACLTGGASSPVLSGLFVIVAIAGAYGGGPLLGAEVLVSGAVPLVVYYLAPRPGEVPPVASTLVMLPALVAVAAASRVAARAGGRRGPAGDRPCRSTRRRRRGSLAAGSSHGPEAGWRDRVSSERRREIKRRRQRKEKAQKAKRREKAQARSRAR